MNDIKLYEKIPELENKFPIKVKSYNSKEIHAHWHEHLELLYIISGEGEFFCSQKSFCAAAGETVVINGSEIHYMRAKNKVEYICVIISPAFFKNIDFKNIILKSKIPKDAFVSQRFEKIFFESENPTPYFDMRIMAETYMLVAYLAKEYTEAKLSPHKYEKLLAGMKKTNSILDFIHENYSEPISTAALAKLFYLSEGYLCHIFKEATGKTIINYLNELRAEKAAVLLEKTDENVLVVAEKCGFENVTYFNRIFKRYSGLTPMEYRNRKRFEIQK